jgi:hypothetical protein
MSFRSFISSVAPLPHTRPFSEKKLPYKVGSLVKILCVPDPDDYYDEDEGVQGIPPRDEWAPYYLHITNIETDEFGVPTIEGHHGYSPLGLTTSRIARFLLDDIEYSFEEVIS